MTGTVCGLLAEGCGRIDRADAAALLQHVLGCSSAWLFAHADDVVEPTATAMFREFVAAREAGRPVAYLTGSRGFWSLDLEVSPAVLIPRVETELLVELALERLPADRPLAVTDLGTGCGAVALALARERPLASLLATDVSREALAVARRNAARLRVANLRFAQGNWCEALIAARFAMIVSNPPYIAEGDPHLEQGDLRFEPRAALAAGCDGLEAICTIIEGARAHLDPGGWLLLEHGWQQGPAVRELLFRGGYLDVLSVPDLEGRERVSGGRSA